MQFVSVMHYIMSNIFFFIFIFFLYINYVICQFIKCKYINTNVCNSLKIFHGMNNNWALNLSFLSHVTVIRLDHNMGLGRIIKTKQNKKIDKKMYK